MLTVLPAWSAPISTSKPFCPAVLTAVPATVRSDSALASAPAIWSTWAWACVSTVSRICRSEASLPDVIWASEQLAKISDQQWQAAFKAGAFVQADADRYIAKIKEKIAQGLALKAAATR